MTRTVPAPAVPADRLARLAELAARRRTAIAAVTIVLLVGAVYGASALRGGLYYDDWSFAGEMHAAPHQTLAGWYHACRGDNTPGRPGSCVFHALSYAAFGLHPRGYHALNLALLAGSTFLLFLLLTACRMKWGLALLVCALLIVFPGSDSTRLWPTASVGLLVVGGYIGAVLIAIEALKRRGRAAIALHALTVAIYAALILTYEIVIPLIAIEGVFLWLALRSRPALRRALVAPAVALAVVAARLLVAGVSSASGFNTHRSLGGLVSHYGHILSGAWRTWHHLFLPGTIGVVLAVACAALVAGVAGALPEARAAIGRRLALAALAAAVAAVALAAYVTANDFYVPDPGSTFNRLNVGAAPAYCVIFVALAAAVWEALRRLVSRPAAFTAVGAVVLAAATSQLVTSARSQQAWTSSWRDQGVTMRSLRALLPQVPPGATIFTLGHPLWERGYIPVLAASWDLRGAIVATTSVRPLYAVPFAAAGVSCTPAGVTISRHVAAYGGSSPVWFLDTRLHRAVQVHSRAECLSAVAAAGPQPFWGRTGA